MKNNPGIKTSEFWIIAIVMVLGAINELSGSKINVTEAAGVWGPAAAYAIARGLAKIKAPAK
jgi:hypothetical protein